MGFRLPLSNIYIYAQMLFLFVISFGHRTSNYFIEIIAIINLFMLFYLANKKKCKLRITELFILFFSVMLFIVHMLTIKDFATVEIFVLISVITYEMIFYRLFMIGKLFVIVKKVEYFAAIYAVYAIVEYLAKKNILYDRWFGAYAYESAIYVIRISFSEPLIIAFVYTIIAFFSVVNFEKERKISVISMLLSLLVCMLTGRRTGMVFSILGIVSIWIIPYIVNSKIKLTLAQLRRWLLIIILGTNSVFLIQIDGQSLIERVINKFKLLSDYSGGGYLSVYHRTRAIELSLLHFKSNGIFKMIFGEGYRKLYEYFSNNQIRISTTGAYFVDNTYISELNDMGLIVVIPFLVYGLFLVFKSIKVIRKLENQHLLRICSVSLVMLMVCLLFIIFFDALYWFPGIILIGLVLAFTRYTCSETFIKEKVDA